MPMGIVSPAEFEREIKDSGINSTITPTPNKPRPNPLIEKGRGKGNVEVPDALRKVIASTAIEESRPDAIEFAKQFGISDSSVGAYTKGATSTASYADRPNAPHIKKVKSSIAAQARNKLKEAIRNITADKLVGSKARDLAGIAKDMSVVASNMESDDTLEKDNRPIVQFLVYQPPVRQEVDYDVVTAKDDY